MDGVALGSVVKVDDSLAQVVDYFPEDGQYQITKINGESKRVPCGDLTAPHDLGRPGQGGEEDSFDVLVGPRLIPDNLGQELGTCIMEKGFCVLRLCQDVEAVSVAVECVRSMGQETPSRLRRLPEEVEPGYLGTGARGKISWMEAGSSTAPKDPTLKANDEFLSRLVFNIMPHTLNSLGKVAEMRTSALVSLSLLPGEEDEYPSPFADSEILSRFLKTWQRSLLKAVHFMGPGTANVLLKKAGDEELPVSKDLVKIRAVPNTIVLFRTGCFDYMCDMPQETLSMMVQFTEPQFRLTPVTSGLSHLDVSSMGLPGPKCPSGERVVVVNESTRLAAGFDAPEMYTWGLAKGVDVGVEIPISRFDISAYYNPDQTSLQPWQTIFKHMGFVEGLENFDHQYFNISKQEALGLDPMHRHLLETGAMNLYKMGITKKYADRNPHHAGCAVGLDKDDFQVAAKDPLVEQIGGNNVQAIIANRFNYTFNLKGASYVADTACSSSLSASHMATLMMENRRTDKLEFFICAGLHQCLAPYIWIGMSQSHMASTIGRCMTFNETADGYLRGDGCSAITLKYGEMAQERQAIWRGSMVGQNGRSATLTAPNGLAQEDVIWKAIREADISPSESTVWSCHGTGTNLGDPIEVGGIRKIMLQAERSAPLIVGTNKTNIGHLEGGAAMTSLIAAINQIRRQYANPLCHGRVLNAYLELGNFEAFFNYEFNSTNLHQGHVHVSSFGFGGTNAHAVLWGEDRLIVENPDKFWQKQMAKMSAPEIRASGIDPADWSSDLPEQVARPGDVWSVIVDKGNLNAPKKWEKTEEALGEEYDIDDISYSIIGSFNDWTPDLMEDGDIPGLKNILVEMPENGQVEFRFVQTVDEDIVLAPASHKCSKKTAPMEGPAVGLTNSWLARGIAGRFLKISLFTSYGRYAVSWVPSC